MRARHIVFLAVVIAYLGVPLVAEYWSPVATLYRELRLPWTFGAVGLLATIVLFCLSPAVGLLVRTTSRDTARDTIWALTGAIGLLSFVLLESAASSACPRLPVGACIEVFDVARWDRASVFPRGPGRLFMAGDLGRRLRSQRRADVHELLGAPERSFCSTFNGTDGYVLGLAGDLIPAGLACLFVAYDAEDRVRDTYVRTWD